MTVSFLTSQRGYSLCVEETCQRHCTRKKAGAPNADPQVLLSRPCQKGPSTSLSISQPCSPGARQLCNSRLCEHSFNSFRFYPLSPRQLTLKPFHTLTMLSGCCSHLAGNDHSEDPVHTSESDILGIHGIHRRATNEENHTGQGAPDMDP